jgi:hypothetical protein
MAVLFLLFALIAPRLVMILLWFFSHWFDGIFTNLLWPIIGFIFLPTTLLWYTVVFNWYDNSWGTVQFVVLVIALLVDLYPAAKKRKRKWGKK